MTTYAWPGFPVSHFEMRVQPNLRGFASPYSNDFQAVNLLGEKLVATVALAPTTDPVEGAAREAFFDRLQGQVRRISMGHLVRSVPRGTLRGGGITSGWDSAWDSAWTGGDPIVAQDVPQLANTAVLRHYVGRTLLAGDMVTLGTQMVRNLTTVTFDSLGQATIEFAPRARQAIPTGAAVGWNAPTTTWMLKPGTENVPTAWTPGVIDGASFELIEVSQ